MQVRHHLMSKLECLKDMPILLELKLSSTMSLDACGSRLGVLSSGSKFPSKTVAPGKITPIYVCADDKYVTPSWYYCSSLSYPYCCCLE